MRAWRRQFEVLLVGLVALVAASCGGEDAAVATTEATPVATTSDAPATTSTTQPPASTTSTTNGADGQATDAAADECAHVIGATVEPTSQGFTVSATVRSADTGWDKYADLWQVRTLDGEILGERELAHPHETEQPFTRSLSGVEIPSEVTAVVIAARDSVVGFCGDEFTAEVAHQ